MVLPLPRVVLVLLAIVALAVGIENMGRRLANPDEGRYSEISREMAQSGDWVTPRLNAIKYFEKPPLQYWATAAAFALLGENEVTARLYIFACGFATILVVGYTARRLWDVESALAAMLVLASSPYFLALGGIVTLDMGLTVWTTTTFCAFLLAEHAVTPVKTGAQSSGPGLRRDERAHWRWMIVGWIAMGLAVLSKGLVGIVFPVATVGTYMLITRDFSALKRLEHRWGVPIFIAITAPWFVNVSLENEDFAQFFFFHEHFGRFLTRAHRRVEPWWYFLPIFFIAGFLPWMFALPSAMARAWTSERGAAFQPLRLSLIWTLLIVAFFSASSSKLPTYVLPAVPPFALVLGRYLREVDPRTLVLWSSAFALLGITFCAAWTFEGWRFLGPDPWTWSLEVPGEPWIVAALGTFFLGGALAALLAMRGLRWEALAMAAFAVILTIASAVRFYEQLEPRQSSYHLAQAMAPWLKPGTEVFSVNTYEQSLPFYIKRTVQLVDYGDEFEAGLLTEGWRVIPETDRFITFWLRSADALAIIHPGYLHKLKRRGMPMQVLYADPRRVLVRKP